MSPAQKVLQRIRLWSPWFSTSLKRKQQQPYESLWSLASHRNVTTKPRSTAWRSNEGVEPHAWFLLAIPITTFALGCWQVKRKYWKEDFIEHMHRRLHRNPVSLPLTMEELDKLEYCPVVVTGVFDHSRELYLGPRTQINVENHKGGGGGGIFSNTRAGYNVITAFKPSDRDYYILVNRGWVPADRKIPTHRSEGQVEGQVTIKGIVRLTESRVPFMAKNMPERNMWLYRDVDKMAEVADTAPIFLDATEEHWVPGGPIGGQTNLSIRNEHFSYIVTWYSLCAATSYMWYKKYIQRTLRHGRFR